MVTATQVEWHQAFAARADVALLTFSWGEQTRTPWVIMCDDHLRWSWAAPEHFPDLGWALSVTVRNHTHNQIFLVALHTHRVATLSACVLVDRRPAVDVLTEIIDRGRRYGARMLQGTCP